MGIGLLKYFIITHLQSLYHVLISSVMYHALVKKRARVPIIDSFIARDAVFFIVYLVRCCLDTLAEKKK